jgi:hypothetical protein
MVRRFQDVGVARIPLIPPGFDPEGLERGLADFHDRVMAKL